MSGEIDRIVRMVEKTFDKYPWFGPSMMDVISKTTSQTANARAGAAHNIIELVLHMTSWRTFATKRLEGDNTYEVSDDLNFPQPGTWEDAMTALDESQAKLIVAMKQFPESRLAELVPSKTQKYTYYTLMHGIIQHDIYHLGQIAILKKALTT
jgi:uncharacterized damage-inducible protein DinB